MGSGLDDGPNYAGSGDDRPVMEIAIEGGRIIPGAEFDSPTVGGEGPESPMSALPANRWTPCDLEAIGCRRPRARTAAEIADGSTKRPPPLGAGVEEGRCSPRPRLADTAPVEAGGESRSRHSLFDGGIFEGFRKVREGRDGGVESDADRNLGTPGPIGDARFVLPIHGRVSA